MVLGSFAGRDHMRGCTDIESEIEESENFCGKIHEALGKLQSCQVVHDQQENPQSEETH